MRLGAEDERSHQEDRKPRGGVPGGYGGGVEEPLSSGAALATARRREVSEVRPLGSTKRHQSGSTALLYQGPELSLYAGAGRLLLRTAPPTDAHQAGRCRLPPFRIKEKERWA